MVRTRSFRSVAVLEVLLVALLLGGCILGGPDVEPGLRVDNRTDMPLQFLSASGDGDEVFHGEVPPRATEGTSVPCGLFPVVARLADGTLVARHGPFQDWDCESNEWVISELP